MKFKEYQECDRCGNKSKNLRIVEGKFYCWRCHGKKITLLQKGMGIIYPPSLMDKRVAITTYLTEWQFDVLRVRLLQFAKDNNFDNLFISKYFRKLMEDEVQEWMSHYDDEVLLKMVKKMKDEHDKKEVEDEMPKV